VPRTTAKQAATPSGTSGNAHRPAKAPRAPPQLECKGPLRGRGLQAKIARVTAHSDFERTARNLTNLRRFVSQDFVGDFAARRQLPEVAYSCSAKQHRYDANTSSRPFASLRSSVSKPSVNQP
jgi:hypothetical protein